MSQLLLNFIIASLLPIYVFAEVNPAVLWANTYGGNRTDELYGATILDGYVFVGNSNSYGEVGNTDALVVRTDIDGNPVWIEVFGGQGADHARDVIGLADGGFLIGGYSSSYSTWEAYYLLKVDSLGEQVWYQTYSTGYGETYGRGLLRSLQSGYLLYGYCEEPDGNPDDGWVTKVDDNGEVEWSQVYDLSNVDRFFDGLASTDQGYLLTGYILSPDSSYNGALINIDDDGTLLWYRTYGDSLTDRLYGIDIGYQGGFVLVGNTFVGDNRQFWIVKTDVDGEVEWEQVFGGDGEDYLRDIKCMNDGSYLVVGYTDSYGNGYEDAWLMQVDQYGQEVWSRALGTWGQDHAWAIESIGNNEYLVSGDTRVGSYQDGWALKLVPADDTGEIIITEIMRDPDAVLDSEGEWFELYNPGPNNINLIGWTFSGTNDESFSIPVDLLMTVNDYAVLGINQDVTFNGGVTLEHEYADFFLSNASDQIIIRNVDYITIDSVAWQSGDAFPTSVGASIALVDPAADNSIGGNWVISDLPFGEGDLGTPGLPNFIPLLNVSDTLLMFDSTMVGALSSLNLVIQNNGNSELNVAEAESSNPAFEIVYFDPRIPAFGVRTVIIVFVPAIVGWNTGTITFTSNSFESGTVDIEVRGYALESNPDIQVRQDSLVFFLGSATDTLRQELSILNTGTETLYLVDIELNPNIQGCWAGEYPQEITAGDSAHVEIFVDPLQVSGTEATDIIIYSNDPDESAVQVSLITSDLTEIEIHSLIASYTLQQNYPNPFNPTTTIRYGLPEAANVSVIIYDVKGREVRRLIQSQQDAGWYSVNWNGLNRANTQVSTGVYFARMQAGDNSEVIKMVYLR